MYRRLTMPGYIDLHTHSTFSDGTLSPTALVAHASDRQLAAVALTDHDTVSGVEEALDAGRSLAIEVIPGIEISARQGNTSLHILGYGLNHRDAGLLAKLHRYQEARRERNTRIIEKLNRLGIEISLTGLRQLALDQIGRPHFARELVRLGVVRSEAAAFTIYLRTGGRAFVESFRYSAEETIAMIREAGGAAVLAHPAIIDPSLAMLPGLLKDLKALGLAGLEVYYPKHSPAVSRRLKKLADDLGLLTTGGSDYHGYQRHPLDPSPNGLDMRVPYHLLHLLKESIPPPRPPLVRGRETPCPQCDLIKRP